MNIVSQWTWLGFLAAGLSPAARAASGRGTPEILVNPVETAQLVQSLAGLLAIVTLILGIAWLVRRVGATRLTARGPLRVLGGLALGPRERVVLMQVGDRQLLLGVAPGEVRTLYVFRDSGALGGAANARDGFAAHLAQVSSGSKRNE